MDKRRIRHCLLCHAVISNRSQSGICPECQRIRRNAERRRKKLEPILGGPVRTDVLPIPIIERITSEANRRKEALCRELGLGVKHCGRLSEGDVRIVLEAAQAVERG
jgi:hypothetical protein